MLTYSTTKVLVNNFAHELPHSKRTLCVCVGPPVVLIAGTSPLVVQQGGRGSSPGAVA